MTSKEKRSRIRYFIVLGIYTAILLAVAFVVFSKFWKFAELYENSRLENVVNEYMVNINNDKWNDMIKTAADKLENSFQDKEDVEDAVKEFLNKDIITYTSGTLGDVVKYNLNSQGKKIGYVEFTEDQTKDYGYDGFPWYYLGSVIPWLQTGEGFDFEFLRNEEPYTITIPETYSLKLNGKEVGEEYITETGIQYDVLSQYYASYPDLPTKVTYEVNDLVGEINAIVYDAEGNEFTIDPTVNDMQFVVPCTDAENNELCAFMENGFCEAYVKFWGTKNVDATYPELMNYVKMNSNLQQEMYIYTLDAATWIHTNYVVVNDMSFNYALSLGGGCYVVSENMNTTAVADYKTVEETSDVVVIVMKDPDTGEILAIDRA